MLVGVALLRKTGTCLLTMVYSSRYTCVTSLNYYHIGGYRGRARDGPSCSLCQNCWGGGHKRHPLLPTGPKILHFHAVFENINSQRVGWRPLVVGAPLGNPGSATLSCEHHTIKFTYDSCISLTYFTFQTVLFLQLVENFKTIFFYNWWRI